MSRRSIQVFNMSFLDMMTNFLGAVIILFLLAARQMGEIPFKSVKGTAKVTFNEKTREISGKIDPSVLQAMEAGDTLLVIISKKVKEDGKIAEAPPPKAVTQQPLGTIIGSNQMVVDKTEFEKLKQDPTPDKCLIFPTLEKISACNDNGTAQLDDDDTYTAEVKISAAGKCGTLWRDDKTDGVFGYGRTKTYIFKIKDGPQKINFTDNSNASVTGSIAINPPPPCKQTSLVVQPTNPNNVVGGSIPPGVNFQVEFDENQGNVDLYVEKDRKWVFGGKRKDESIGQWTNEKVGFLSAGKTGLERVRQLTPIPGTYKIYAHYRGGSVSSLKVALIISSKKTNQSQKFDFIVPQSKNNPKNGGGMLLKTVMVTADGTLK